MLFFNLIIESWCYVNNTYYFLRYEKKNVCFKMMCRCLRKTQRTAKIMKYPEPAKSLNIQHFHDSIIEKYLMDTLIHQQIDTRLLLPVHFFIAVTWVGFHVTLARHFVLLWKYSLSTRDLVVCETMSWQHESSKRSLDWWTQSNIWRNCNSLKFELRLYRWIVDQKTSM